MTTAPAQIAATGSFSDHWRLSATRLIAIYGVFFLVWSVVLAAIINWQTSRYLENVVDNILQQRLHYFSSVERERLPEMLAATPELDLRGVMAYGLFDAEGRYLAGDIESLPKELLTDGIVHELPEGVQRVGGGHSEHTRGIALRREDGLMLALTRSYSNVDQVGVIIRNSLLWALSFTFVPGLLGGYLLSRGPLRRVRDIETAIQPIMRGELSARLPVSGRRDELDMLAIIVNRMLDQLTGLLGEVKSVSDNIAHDLRTPLTRLRAQLHRLQRDGDNAEDRALLLERCIEETNTLLDRFRALLRISELEDLRRQAGFRDIDIVEILHRAHELYAPLAEDKAIDFTLDVAALPTVRADAELLFEAVANLVSNAIKFTPANGRIALRAVMEARGARIEVLDNGPGIADAERSAVLQRFYRTERGRRVPGLGLGLSIVAAIVKLHGFRFEVGANQPIGARMTIVCSSQLASGASAL